MSVHCLVAAGLPQFLRRHVGGAAGGLMELLVIDLLHLSRFDILAVDPEGEVFVHPGLERSAVIGRTEELHIVRIDLVQAGTDHPAGLDRRRPVEVRAGAGGGR